MEYKSISSKLPRNEVNLFRDYCERKGVTPSSLIRELILKEIKVSVPINVQDLIKSLMIKKMIILIGL